MNFIEAFVIDILNSYFIFHITVGILRKVGALVEKNPWCKVGNLPKLFFVSCHAIKLKINGLNRLKAKNHR